MRCERCAGLVVAEHFSAGKTSVSGWAYGEWRCVNCGAMGLSRPAGERPVTDGLQRPQVGGQRPAPNRESRRS